MAWWSQRVCKEKYGFKMPLALSEPPMKVHVRGQNVRHHGIARYSQHSGKAGTLTLAPTKALGEPADNGPISALNFSEMGFFFFK